MADSAAAAKNVEPEAEAVNIIPDWKRKLIEITGEESRRARPIAKGGHAVMSRLSQEHDELVQAITDHQADRAVELLDQHLEHTTIWLGLSVTTLAIPGVTPIPAERFISEQEPTPAEGETPTPEELAEAAAKFGWQEDLVKRALALGTQPDMLIAQQEGMKEEDAT